MIERTADDLEIADQLAQDERDRGLAKAQASLAPEKDERFDGKHCVEEDCGSELAPVRIAYGRVRCAACQTRIEENLKRKGRK